MYCISIAEPSAERSMAIMADAQGQMVELRGDLCRLCPEELARVVASHPAVLYTCHLEGLDLAWAEEQYRVAIAAGARWVDVEISAPTELRHRIVAMAHSAGAKVVVSYHNYTHTPEVATLVAVAEECWAAGADIAKVVTTATDVKDIISISKLYRTLPADKSAQLVAFAMGSEGASSRRLSLIEGAPFTFVAPDGGTPTAPGQPTLAELRATMEHGHRLEGLATPLRATLPSSKSYFQRAVVAATLAEGVSHLTYGGELCDDSRAAIEWARTLGAEVEVAEESITISGIGSEGFVQQLPHTFDVGESGLLARLTLGIVAMAGGGATVVGRGTLAGRSFERDIEVLRSLGIEVESNAGRLPITIGGQIEGQSIVVDASHSSQLASGLLMGLPLANRSVALTINNPASKPYLDMTLDVMLLFGIDYGAGYGSLGDSVGEPLTVSIGGGEAYRAGDLGIEADWSSAGYLLAAAAIAQSGPAVRPEGYTIGGLNFYSHQADRLIMSQLLISNDNLIEFANSRTTERTFDGYTEPVQDVCDIVVHPTQRLGTIYCSARNAPDAIPTLAVIALFAEGQSYIKGLDRLTNKESNRRSALVAELLALGADIDIEGDALVVNGGRPLRSAPLCTYGDHRMAMALAVAAMFIGKGSCTLDQTECVAKSWPAFWQLFGLE